MRITMYPLSGGPKRIAIRRGVPVDENAASLPMSHGAAQARRNDRGPNYTAPLPRGERRRDALLATGGRRERPRVWRNGDRPGDHHRSSDVEVAHAERVGLDERTPGLDLLAHQRGEDFLRADGILD